MPLFSSVMTSSQPWHTGCAPFVSSKSRAERLISLLVTSLASNFAVDNETEQLPAFSFETHHHL
jgi:hypothetical protein